MKVVKGLVHQLLREESNFVISKFEQRINKAIGTNGNKLLASIKGLMKQILQDQLKKSEKKHMLELKKILEGILEQHPLFGEVEQWQNITIAQMEYLLPKITWDSKGNMAFFSTINTCFNNIWSFLMSIYLFFVRRNVKQRKKERIALKTKKLTV